MRTFWHYLTVTAEKSTKIHPLPVIFLYNQSQTKRRLGVAGNLIWVFLYTYFAMWVIVETVTVNFFIYNYPWIPLKFQKNVLEEVTSLDTLYITWLHQFQNPKDRSLDRNYHQHQLLKLLLCTLLLFLIIYSWKCYCDHWHYSMWWNKLTMQLLLALC